MKNKEKEPKLTTLGFTLIELLAVIVILAIVALIATPIILNIIENTKEESNKRSIEMYAKAVENAVVLYQLKAEDVKQKITFSDIESYIQYDGGVSCGRVEIYEDGKIYLSECKIDDAPVNYTYGSTSEDNSIEDPTLDVGPIIKTDEIFICGHSLAIPFSVEDSQFKIESITCEYGLDTNYGKNGEIFDLSSNDGYYGKLVGHKCVMSFLDVNVTYYYKITATNSNGVSKTLEYSYYSTYAPGGSN